MPVVRASIDLQAVHAHVALPGLRVVGEHHRQGDEGAAVPGPAGQDRDLGQVRVVAPEDNFLARSLGHLLGEHPAQAGQLGNELELLHQGVGFRLHEAQKVTGDVVQGLNLQRQAHAPHGPEGVHQHRHVVAGDILEQQGRPPGLGDPVGDFGDGQIRAHRLLDAHQLPGLLQPGDKFLQIPITHVIPFGDSC